MRIVLAVVVGVMWSASIARADVELKNDGFVTGGTAGFQAGFVTGEIGAARFVAPAAGRQLRKVQFLFGGSTALQTITLKVYDDTAGADVPGTELHSADYQVTGSDSALQEIDLAADNITVPAQFRVGIVFQHNGVPSIARDADNTIAAAKNYIFGVPGGWIKSNLAGLTGDWVIRAFVTDGGVTPPDGAIDAGVDAAVAAMCSGNGECPTGQFCDLANHACTFECRTNSDCGGGTCNSLGQCIGGAGAGGGGGGCCRTDHGTGTTGGALLAVGVLGALVVRRRRR